MKKTVLLVCLLLSASVFANVKIESFYSHRGMNLFDDGVDIAGLGIGARFGKFWQTEFGGRYGKNERNDLDIDYVSLYGNTGLRFVRNKIGIKPFLGLEFESISNGFAFMFHNTNYESTFFLAGVSFDYDIKFLNIGLDLTFGQSFNGEIEKVEGDSFAGSKFTKDDSSGSWIISAAAPVELNIDIITLFIKPKFSYINYDVNKFDLSEKIFDVSFGMEF